MTKGFGKLMRTSNHPELMRWGWTSLSHQLWARLRRFRDIRSEKAALIPPPSPRLLPLEDVPEGQLHPPLVTSRDWLAERRIDLIACRVELRRPVEVVPLSS